MEAERNHGPQKFRALESWRGICAIGVVLVHISLNSHIRTLAAVRNAGLGVDFFFVLSGFVLGHAYSGRLTTLRDAREFIIRRTGRLLPLHLFALAILVALELLKLFLVSRFHVSAGDAPFTGANSIAGLVASLFLVNGLGIIQYFTWNGPSWSVSTEFWAYLLFLMACLAHKYRLVASLLAVGCGLALLDIEMRHLPLHTYNGVGLLRCLCGFSCGNLLNLLYRQLVARNVAPPPLAEYLALAIIAAIFIQLSPHQYLLAPLGFSVAILIFAFERGLVSRILTTRIPLHLGLVSYSIYLMHMPVLDVMNGLARTVQSKLHLHLYVPGTDGQLLLNVGGAWANDLATVFVVLLVIGVASFTYYAIENPGRIYFNAIGRRVRSSPRIAVGSSLT